MGLCWQQKLANLADLNLALERIGRYGLKMNRSSALLVYRLENSCASLFKRKIEIDPK